MKAHTSVRRDAKKRGIVKKHCPNCGSSEIIPHKVNDQFRAVDPRGEIFEIGFQAPVWTCLACNLCWQGQEALAAKEAAYQYALVKRSPSRITA